MPIIYSYPNKTNPTTGDLLLISDVSASNQTKKITIGDLKDPLDVVDSLNSLTGDLSITGHHPSSSDEAQWRPFVEDPSQSAERHQSRGE